MFNSWWSLLEQLMASSRVSGQDSSIAPEKNINLPCFYPKHWTQPLFVFFCHYVLTHNFISDVNLVWSSRGALIFVSNYNTLTMMHSVVQSVYDNWNSFLKCSTWIYHSERSSESGVVFLSGNPNFPYTQVSHQCLTGLGGSRIRHLDIWQGCQTPCTPGRAMWSRVLCSQTCWFHLKTAARSTVYQVDQPASLW